MVSHEDEPSLETNSNFAPENGSGWNTTSSFLLGWPIFRCKLLVSGNVFINKTLDFQVCTLFSAVFGDGVSRIHKPYPYS